MGVVFCNANSAFDSCFDVCCQEDFILDRHLHQRIPALRVEHNRAENFVITDIFEPGSENEDQENSWQTQDEIEKDMQWCVHSLRTRRHELLPDAVLKNNIIESALDWSLI